MSVVDELVAYKLEELVQQKEEEQIYHERQKTEQLKELERQRKTEIKRIQDDANDEMEYLVERIKHEVKIAMEDGLLNEEARKQDLQRQSKQAIGKAQEKWNKTEETKREQQSTRLTSRLDAFK